MSRFPILLFFILLGLNTFASISITGKVVGISDGDTFTILTTNKEQIKIRLYGVDCPESKQDFGTKAKQFTSSLCFGKTVIANIKNNDRYGRKIAFVILPNGRNLNKELLIAGMAWHYKHYDKSTELASLEAMARQKKVGVWSAKNPVAPWEYRQNKKFAKKTDASKSNFVLCSGLTKAGKHCKHKAKYAGKCWQHREVLTN